MRYDTVAMPSNRMKPKSQDLKEEGFIIDYAVRDVKKTLTINLKYGDKGERVLLVLENF